MNSNSFFGLTSDHANYDLPSGWAWATISELTLSPRDDIVDGPFGSNLKASEYVNSGTPIVRLQNIDRNKFLRKNIHFITAEKAEQLRRHNYSKGDILITKLGAPLGKACLVPNDFDDGIIVADVVRIRISSQYASNRYVMFAINSEADIKQLAALTKGTTRPRVNLSHIRSLRVPLAPIAEQHRIVAKIEELFTRIDASLDSLEHVKARLKQYRRSVLTSAYEGKLTKESLRDEIAHPQILKEPQTDLRDFSPTEYDASAHVSNLPQLPEGWSWRQLIAINDVTSGVAFKSPDFVEKGVPVIKISNISYGKFQWKQQEFLPEAFLERYAHFKTLPGNILIALTRPITKDMLKVCIYPEDAPVGLLNQRVASIEPHKGYSVPFLFNFMRTELFKNQVKSTLSETLQPNLLDKNLKKLFCPVTSVDEQNKVVKAIGARLSIVEEVEKIVQHELTQANRMKPSLLKKAFTGNLTIQDRSEEPASILLDRIRIETKNQSVRRGKSTNKNKNRRNLTQDGA